MPYVLVDRPVPEVAVVTLNRPERMNAMAFDVMVPSAPPSTSSARTTRSARSC